ncbi:MAG: hypothetical protein IPN92_07115 [Chromatiaceae bacterium]|nr:hypothetical protein [Chromatiaceae bacterium]
MARTALTLPTDLIRAEDAIQIRPEALAAERQMAALDAQRREQATQLATQLAYDGELTPAALMDGVRIYQRRTVEDCLALGKCLLLLQELTDRGAWLPTLATLGITKRTAQRFMMAAYKTAKSVNLALMSRHLGSASKMLELLVFDDDEAGDLLGGGTVAGLTLDAVECMTATQLRAALRDARETVAAKERLLEVKSKKIDDLDTALAKRQPAEAIPHADLEAHGLAVRAELSRRVFHCEMDLVGELPPAIEALLEHGRASGEPVHDLIAGHLGQLAGDIESLLLRYGADIPRGRATPDADIWDAVNAEIAAKAAAEEGHDPPRRIN